MDEIIIKSDDLLVMNLINYFITEENYKPMIIHGINDEIWLENLDNNYKIVRIVSHHIHNKEQLDFDKFKLSKIVKQVKRKTLSFKVKVLSIYTDIEDEKIYEDKRLEVNGNIKIVNLSYTFNNKYYVLKNINLFIKDKDRVLLLGSSGSGKSTILKLLYKYLQADRNKIFINNYDINDYSMSDIRSSITYVSQNELLFNDTIRNNILLDRDVSEVDYLNICKILHIDDIVKDNILGYDYILEENGINISGGQRQRIILARSLLKNSKIIMIDEGFNQIDIKLEREILLDIFRYFHDRTFIIISHRIENSDLYNRVIKIDNGFVNMIEEVYNE